MTKKTLAILIIACGLFLELGYATDMTVELVGAGELELQMYGLPLICCGIFLLTIDMFGVFKPSSSLALRHMRKRRRLDERLHKEAGFSPIMPVKEILGKPKELTAPRCSYCNAPLSSDRPTCKYCGTERS